MLKHISSLREGELGVCKKAIQWLVVDYQSKFVSHLLCSFINIEDFISPRRRSGLNKAICLEKGELFCGLLIKIGGHTSVRCSGGTCIFIKLERKMDKKVVIFLERVIMVESGMGSGTGSFEQLEDGIIGQMVEVRDVCPWEKVRWGGKTMVVPSEGWELVKNVKPEE